MERNTLQATRLNQIASSRSNSSHSTKLGTIKIRTRRNEPPAFLGIGAGAVLFVAGDADRTSADSLHIGRFHHAIAEAHQLLAGDRQFAEDAVDYTRL